MVEGYIRLKPFHPSARPYQTGYRDGREAAAKEIFSDDPVNRKFVREGRIHDLADLTYHLHETRQTRPSYFYPSETDAYFSGFIDGFEFEANRLLGGQRQLGEF